MNGTRFGLLIGLAASLGSCGVGGGPEGTPAGEIAQKNRRDDGGGGLPEIVRLDAPDSIEVGEPFTVHVVAAYERGVDAVEIRFEGHTTRLDGRDLARVRLSARIEPRLATLQLLEATAVGTDGVRGSTARIAVAVSTSDVRPGTDDRDEFLRILAASTYGRDFGPSAYRGDPLDRNGPIARGQGWVLEAADSPGFHFEPWWKRWLDDGGPQHWDWQAACGDDVTHVGPTGDVLFCWLDQHPDVAQRIVWELVDHATGDVTPVAYPNWSFSRKLDLAVAFWEAYHWLENGLGFFLGQVPTDPPVNQIPLADCSYVYTGLTDQAAWKLYVGTVAHSLALEIGGFVPWSVTGYTVTDLETLFHSKYMFDAGHTLGSTFQCANSQIDFTGYVVDGPVIPAPATTTFEFLVDEDIVRNDHWKTISRLMTWARTHMFHIGGGPDAKNMEAYYQYRGDAPASRLMTGTTWTNPDNPASQSGPASWSPSGCHGVAHFFRAVMRGANIPVRYQYICGHGVPVFWTVGRTMTHGDDIYNTWSKVTPAFPANLLLITTQQFVNFFGNCDNIGRRPYDILVDLVPNELVDLYCEDVTNNLSHAQGAVYELFDTWYSVQTLESEGLWTKLASKAAQKKGGCGP